MPTGVGTNIGQNGQLASTTAAAGQTILTYTVPAGKTLMLELIEANVKLTTFAATATDFGPIKFNVNGTKLFQWMAAGAGIMTTPIYTEFPDALQFAAGDVITITADPTAVTPMSWEANLAGWLRG